MLLPMNKNENKSSITFVFIRLYPDITGGAEIFNYYLIKEISKLYPVNLICNSDPCIDGVKFFRIKPLKPIRFFYPFQLLYSLYKSSKKSSAIYTSFMRASWLVYFPILIHSCLYKIPYSFTIHGGGMIKWKFKIPYLLFFRNAHEITGVSYGICDEYKKRTGIHITYLPPLIPFFTTNLSSLFLRSKYNLPPDKKIILFVGSLKTLKNPLNILKALQILGREYIEQNNLIMVFAGDGVLKDEIIKYAQNINISDYVFMLGNVAIECIHELYSLSDYYIISSSFEGTPIALLEAMFNGLPILASDAPGINNILKHNETAILYKTEDINELAAGLKHITTFSDKADLIKQNAKKYFNQHFNYNKIINEYIKVIIK